MSGTPRGQVSLGRGLVILAAGVGVIASFVNWYGWQQRVFDHLTLPAGARAGARLRAGPALEREPGRLTSRT